LSRNSDFGGRDLINKIADVAHQDSTEQSGSAFTSKQQTILILIVSAKIGSLKADGLKFRQGAA
jgi:hypothetical protein